MISCYSAFKFFELCIKLNVTVTVTSNCSGPSFLTPDTVTLLGVLSMIVLFIRNNTETMT